MVKLEDDSYMRILVKNYSENWESFFKDIKTRSDVELFFASNTKEPEKNFDLVLNCSHEKKATITPMAIKLFHKEGPGLLKGDVRKMLEAIIYAVQDAISVVDENGIGILINPAYTRITGLTEEDVIGNPATVDIAEGERMHYTVLKTGQPVSGVPMKVGPKRKDVIVNVSPIVINGELKGSVGVIHDISEISRLTEELQKANQLLRHLRAKYTFADIIGSSAKIKEVINKAKKASQTPATVLLRGESGTGKELFAHAIHNESSRNKGQFIRVNCPAIPDTLLESELFGYQEGAFTGARRGGKKGLFLEANHGTIFLDEIARLNFTLQAKILRVLQEREFIPIGGNETVAIDVRFIVATNADLEQEVEKGNFREDLYYRLNVFPIYIPPLRERKEDIPELVNHMIRRFNQEYGRMVEGVTKEALTILQDYNWPGNIRELENVIGRAIIEAGFSSKILQVSHFPPLGALQKVNKDRISDMVDFAGHMSLKELMMKTEEKALRQALRVKDGSRKETAEMLGISVRTLYYKLEKYGLV